MTGRFFGGGIAPLALVISTNQTNYNIRTAALAAGLGASAVRQVIVTILVGVSVGGMNTGSGWPAGTPKPKIINHGRLGSYAGAGGNGEMSGLAATDGQPGGDVLTLGIDVEIDNGDGQIFSGGGGGGGGGHPGNLSIGAGGGGGGGGGQGDGAAGLGKNGGTDGTAGADSAPGVCGNGQGRGGQGGNGGNYGEYGQDAPGAGADGGGFGGAPGRAIVRNGFTATFIAGGDSAHLRGPVA